MNIQNKTTILRLAIDGYFLQQDSARQSAADSIFALTDDIEEYIHKEISESDRSYCLSIVKEIKEFAEKCFKNPRIIEKPAELEILMGNLIRLAHVKPKVP